MSRFPFDESEDSVWNKHKASLRSARDRRSAWQNAEAMTFSESEWKKVQRMQKRSKQIGNEVAADCYNLEIKMAYQRKCPERKPTA